MELDARLAEKLTALQDEGFEIWRRFDIEVRQHDWHPFVPVEYGDVLAKLLELRAPGLKFLEWGSATGVITIMADLLGYDAAGIELDAQLVAIARDLARKYDSRARFAVGSFLPAGYQWTSSDGDTRLGTIGHGPSGPRGPQPRAARRRDGDGVVGVEQHAPWGVVERRRWHDDELLDPCQGAAERRDEEPSGPAEVGSGGSRDEPGRRRPDHQRQSPQRLDRREAAFTDRR